MSAILSRGSGTHFDWHFFLINMYALVHMLLVFLHVQMLLLFSPDDEYLCQRTVPNDAYMCQGNPNGVHGYNTYLYLQMMGSFSHIQLHNFIHSLFLFDNLTGVYFGTVVSQLQWGHNERDGVSIHRRIYCLRSRLFRRRSKKTSKLRVTGLCERNSPVNSPHKGPVTRRTFTFDDVIMTRMYTQ